MRYIFHFHRFSNVWTILTKSEQPIVVVEPRHADESHHAITWIISLYDAPALHSATYDGLYVAL